MLLCAHGPYPANQPEPRAAKPSPTSFTLSRASVRFANAPASAQVHHILSAFVRSCSADKEKEKNKKAFIFLCFGIICIGITKTFADILHRSVMYIKIFHNGFAGLTQQLQGTFHFTKLQVPFIMVVNFFINRQVLFKITDIAPVPVHVAKPFKPKPAAN